MFVVLSTCSDYLSIPLQVALERKTDEMGELRRMAVDPECRGNSVGTRLVGNLLDHARKEGFKRVFLTTLTCNTRAVTFYERLGFALVREMEFPIADDSIQLSELAIDL